MAYTTINKSGNYFNTVTYTGNGNAGHSITGVGFQPDWTWVKNRSDTYGHNLVNSVTNTLMFSNANAPEEAIGNTVTSFDSDGFTVGTNAGVNANGQNLVSWNWLGSNTTAANTDGSINSTVSANTTSGFSIVSYTGNQTSGATVGHGLGSKPEMIIFKERNGTASWVVYHNKNTSAPATQYLQLNSTNATGTYAGYFNNTEPTSSVFTLGNDTGINQSGDTYIAYCFAEKQGYSKFGSYVGNGNADGSFIYTGFKPAFVMIKLSSAANENWAMYDNKRDTFNSETTQQLRANSSSTESASTSEVNLLSNGFKVNDSNAEINAAGSTYIYMTFAEAPLVGTNNVPCTAR